eukprot:3360933-Rhodomonas_salina.4
MARLVFGVRVVFGERERERCGSERREAGGGRREAARGKRNSGRTREGERMRERERRERRGERKGRSTRDDDGHLAGLDAVLLIVLVDREKRRLVPSVTRQYQAALRRDFQSRYRAWRTVRVGVDIAVRVDVSVDDGAVTHGAQ